MLLENRHIFIVEDDPRNLSITSAILKRHGAKVSYDRWGQATIQLIERLPPVDIIILDLNLPHDVSGFDVFKHIRNTEGLEHIPVVLVTASDPDREMKKAHELGMNGFIAKPIDSQTFPKYIASIIEGNPVWLEMDE